MTQAQQAPPAYSGCVKHMCTPPLVSHGVSLLTPIPQTHLVLETVAGQPQTGLDMQRPQKTSIQTPPPATWLRVRMQGSTHQSEPLADRHVHEEGRPGPRRCPALPYGHPHLQHEFFKTPGISEGCSSPTVNGDSLAPLCQPKVGVAPSCLLSGGLGHSKEPPSHISQCS